MMKFGTQTQSLTQATEAWENFRNSQIQDGGRTPYWKSFLAITRLHQYMSRVIATRNVELGGIIAHIRRFGDKNVQFRISNMAEGRHFENHYISISQPQIVRISQNLVCRQILPQATESDKNSDIRKFKMADGRRIDNHFLAITQLHCPIKMKFGVRRENHTNTKQVRWSKCLITKIQNSGGQHFENGYTSVSELRIVQIWRNMLHKRKFWHSRGNMTNINLKSIYKEQIYF